MKSNEKINDLKSLVNGYKSTFLIISAARLGVFDELSKGHVSALDISKNLGVSENKLEPLLNALVNLEILKKCENEFFLDEFKDVLDPASPNNQLGYINHALNMCDKWRMLEETIKDNQLNHHNFESITGENLAQTRAFLQAMNTNAIPQAEFLVNHFDFTNHKFIDIGAGYGTYSMRIAQKFSTAQGVVFDLPIAAQVINENVSASGLNKNLRVIAGNYKTDLPNEQFDDAFLFAVIHQESTEDAKKLLKSVYDKLYDNGKLYLTSFFLDDEKTSPRFSVMFGIEMLVGSENGKAYSHKEIQQLLNDVGFSSIESVKDIPGPATLYIATKNKIN